MAIVVKKKESVRNTPILNFALVLSIPILLSFLAGTTFKSVNVVNKNTANATIGECEVALEKQMLINQNLQKISDSLVFLKKEFKNNIKVMESDLQSLPSDDMRRIRQWIISDKDPVLFKWDRDLKALRETFKADFDNSFHQLIDNQFELFEEVIALNKVYLENQIDEVTKKANINPESPTNPNDPCFSEKMQLLTLNGQISAANADYKNCQTELLDAKRTIEQLKSNSNRIIVEKVKVELKTIQENLIPKINQSLFGKSSKMDQLKDELSSKVNNILLEINNIK